MEKNKIWYLSTCDTCTRIMKELCIKRKGDLGWDLIDIKQNIIDSNSLDLIKKSLDCSYEDLFNKRAQKYTKTDLKASIQSEDDFRSAILEEYTFLKRPIIKLNGKYFVGSSEIKKFISGTF